MVDVIYDLQSVLAATHWSVIITVVACAILSVQPLWIVAEPHLLPAPYPWLTDTPLLTMNRYIILVTSMLCGIPNFDNGDIKLFYYSSGVRLTCNIMPWRN